MIANFKKVFYPGTVNYRRDTRVRAGGAGLSPFSFPLTMAGLSCKAADRAARASCACGLVMYTIVQDWPGKDAIAFFTALMVNGRTLKT